jgi:hypothetical protein
MKLTKKHYIIIAILITIIVVWYFFLRKKKAESGYAKRGKSPCDFYLKGRTTTGQPVNGVQHIYRPVSAKYGKSINRPGQSITVFKVTYKLIQENVYGTPIPSGIELYPAPEYIGPMIYTAEDKISEIKRCLRGSESSYTKTSVTPCPCAGCEHLPKGHPLCKTCCSVANEESGRLAL